MLRSGQPPNPIHATTVFVVRFQRPHAEEQQRAHCHCAVNHGHGQIVDLENLEKSGTWDVCSYTFISTPPPSGARGQTQIDDRAN